MSESRGHGWLIQHGVVVFLGFRRRNVTDRLEQPTIVEPVHPFQCCDLDGLEAPPWPTSMDYLGLVETVDRFGESIVVAVADAADRGFDTGFRQALSVANG